MHELLSPALNFAILVAGLVYFLRKPVRDMIAQRRSQIETNIREAEAARREAQAKFKAFQERLISFEEEAQGLLARAEREAQAAKERIIVSARVAAERAVKEAEQTAQASVQEFKDQIRRETIAKMMGLAEKMIRERVSSDDQRRIVTEYVGKVESRG